SVEHYSTSSSVIPLPCQMAQRSCPGTAAPPAGAWKGDRVDCAPSIVCVGLSWRPLEADRAGWPDSLGSARLDTGLSSRLPPEDAGSCGPRLVLAQRRLCYPAAAR